MVHATNTRSESVGVIRLQQVTDRLDHCIADEVTGKESSLQVRLIRPLRARLPQRVRSFLIDT